MIAIPSSHFPDYATVAGIQAWANSELAARDTTIAGLQAQVAKMQPKYAKMGEQTNNSGVWSANLGANVFTNSPSVSVQPRMSSGLYVNNVQTSGNASSGFTVTVTFQRIAASITGILGLISLTVSISSPVTFDIQAFEPTT